MGTKKTRPRAPGEGAVRVSEEEGAGSLASTPREGEVPTAKRADVTKLEKALGVRLPAGYATFVTQVGEGIYGNLVRVYSPRRIGEALGPFRERVASHWFWGERPLSREAAQEAVCIGDTLAGDDLVIHPRDPDAVVLLPRESERARVLGRGLAPALAKLVKANAPTLRPFARAEGARKAAPARRQAARPADPDRIARSAVAATVSSLARAKLEKLLQASSGILARHPAWSAELVIGALMAIRSKAKVSVSGPLSTETLAAITEHRRVLDLLLTQGAEVQRHDGVGHPLSTAVSVGYPPFVEALLARGAAVDEGALTLAEGLLGKVDPHGRERFEEICRMLRAHRAR